MEKVAIITDSSCDLDIKVLEKYDIKVLPLKVIYDEQRTYRDRIDISPQEVYARMPGEVPTTSMPSPGDAQELLTQLREAGYRQVLAILISSGLSGTYQTFSMVAKEFADLEIEVVDSKSLSMGLGFLVLAAVEELEKGRSFKEIASKIRQLSPFSKVYYVLETLEYLRKGGRIGLVAATVGSFLDIKPIISVNEDGMYYTVEKVRGRKKSINKIFELVQEAAARNRIRVAVMHGNALAEAEKLAEDLKGLSNLGSIDIGQISPVLGVHTGPGLLGVTLLAEV